jgi:ribosome-binding factor A
VSGADALLATGSSRLTAEIIRRCGRPLEAGVSAARDIIEAGARWEWREKMKKPAYRIERINETIREVLSELLLGQIKDPRVGMVTITAVRVSSDMSSAKVHYSVMGDESKRAETEQGLKSAKNFMRKTVADELKLRVAPELRFVYDDSLDKSFAIEEALKKSSEETSRDDESSEEDEKETR